jgi:hypothetical protein
VIDAKLRQRVYDGIDYDTQRRGGAPSPAGWKPSGCVVDGTSLISVVNDGNTRARGARPHRTRRKMRTIDKTAALK